jgi:hypothetical protein
VRDSTVFSNIPKAAVRFDVEVGEAVGRGVAAGGAGVDAGLVAVTASGGVGSGAGPQAIKVRMNVRSRLVRIFMFQL